MRTIVAELLLLIGATFVMLAALGLLRLPDVFMRLQATTKASTLGIGAISIAVALIFNDGAVTMRALLVLAFVILTAPAGAHAIARAAHRSRATMWAGTLVDELRLAQDADVSRSESETQTNAPD